MRETNSNSLTAKQRADLINLCAEYSLDPLGFVYAAFPWGEPGKGLENKDGPDQWQIDVLEDIRERLQNNAMLDDRTAVDTVIREAVASGHGIGKSALVSFLILWAIGTYEDTRGVVTANTATQLETKTWAELSKWYNLCIIKDLFKWTATSIYSTQKGHEKTWRIDSIPWSKDKSEGFAGLHNEGKRILYIFDEASAIDDIIWEVTDGATTDADTEIMWCAFGNPTRNFGRFYECFNKYRHRWNQKQIDSRKTKIANKVLLQQWVDDWGEDSDFVKVRVRGLFPSLGDAQLISGEIVTEAQKRYKTIKPSSYNFAPVIIGVDPAWEGDDKLVVFLRQGNYTKVLMTLPKNDNDQLVAEKLAFFEDEYGMDAGNIDQGWGQGIYSALKSMGRTKWQLIPFSGAATNDYYFNKRSEMWHLMKDWLKEGGAIPDDPQLYNELISPQAFINKKDKMQMESKKEMKDRGVPSPDMADALALTFARNVIKDKSSKYKTYLRKGLVDDYGAM